MYEVIDETLKIASCGINDLTLEQASSFLSQWRMGRLLGALHCLSIPKQDTLS